MKMGFKKESKMKQTIVKIENDASRSGQTLEISVMNKKYYAYITHDQISSIKRRI
jgi:hypothetical protein